MTLHRSLIASERTQDSEDALLGPTGAVAVLSRDLVCELIAAHGCLMAEEFFCYAEDTDLLVRARLLAYTPHLFPFEHAIAVHAGQASSGGKDSDFVHFHGVRNSIWMALRCMPISVLVRCLPWALLAHAGIVAKGIVDKRFKLTLRIYAETYRALPRLLRERRRIQQSRRIRASECINILSRKFYDTNYVGRSLRRVFTFNRSSD